MFNRENIRDRMIAYSPKTVKCCKCGKELIVNFYSHTLDPMCSDCKSGKTEFKKEGYRKEGESE